MDEFDDDDDMSDSVIEGGKIHNVINGNDADDGPPVKLRRNQYTLDVLQSWYDTKFTSQPNDSQPRLTIIMPNFEEFKPTIIKDLIQILRFVLIHKIRMIWWGFEKKTIKMDKFLIELQQSLPAIAICANFGCCYINYSSVKYTFIHRNYTNQFARILRTTTESNFRSNFRQYCSNTGMSISIVMQCT